MLLYVYIYAMRIAGAFIHTMSLLPPYQISCARRFASSYVGLGRTVPPSRTFVACSNKSSSFRDTWRKIAVLTATGAPRYLFTR
jgi:hypothetical protein